MPKPKRAPALITDADFDGAEAELDAGLAIVRALKQADTS